MDACVFFSPPLFLSHSLSFSLILSFFLSFSIFLSLALELWCRFQRLRFPLPLLPAWASALAATATVEARHTTSIMSSCIPLPLEEQFVASSGVWTVNQRKFLKGTSAACRNAPVTISKFYLIEFPCSFLIPNHLSWTCNQNNRQGTR
jgi:hypothetical protein